MLAALVRSFIHRYPRLFLTIAAVAWLGSVAQVANNIIPQLLQGSFIDFEVYEAAAYRFLFNETVYSPSAIGMAYGYPPASLFFVSIFPLAAGQYAVWLFTAASLTAFMWSCWIMVTVVTKQLSCTMTERLSYWLLLSGCLLQTFPVKYTLSSGQINHFVLLVLVLAIRATLTGKNTRSAIFYGVGAVLKLYPFVGILNFLLRKDWRGAAVLTGILVLGVLVLPQHFTAYFTEVLLKQFATHTVQAPVAVDQSLGAAVVRFGLGSVAVQAITWLTALVYVLYLLSSHLFTRKRKSSVPVVETLVLPLIFILGHSVWSHQLVLLYPFFVLGVSKNWQRGLLWLALVPPLPAIASYDAALLFRASIFPLVLFLILLTNTVEQLSVHARFVQDPQ